MHNLWCLYHADCADGIAAALAWQQGMLKRLEGNIIYNTLYYRAVQYGDDFRRLFAEIGARQISARINEPSSRTHIYFVDFSVSKDLLLKLTDEFELVVVIDHHKTAKEQLKGLEHPNLHIVFDMERSGAQITSDYFGLPRSNLVDYVADRDLWQWKLKNSHEINAWIATYPFTLKHMALVDDILENAIQDNKDIGYENAERSYAQIIAEGDAAIRTRLELCKSIVDLTARMVNIGGYNVPIINCPYKLHSEALHYLMENKDPPHFVGEFAAAYFDLSDGRRKISLRSVGEFDVSKVAKSFNGGGHRNAASFHVRMPKAIGQIIPDEAVPKPSTE